MWNNPPKNYSLTLPRVSAIVEYNYPFSWNAKERFEDWLMSNDIDADEYMKEASTWGTFVHSKLEDYLNGKIYRGRKYTWFINSWIQFVKDHCVQPVGMEEYVSTEYFQWTMDLVGKIDWLDEEWILDWKSYWLAKYKFWLPIPTHKRPYDKLKKARLQLSLYAMAKWLEKIWVIELTPEGYFFYPLEKIPNEQLIKLCKEYQFHYVDEI